MKHSKKKVVAVLQVLLALKQSSTFNAINHITILNAMNATGAKSQRRKTLVSTNVKQCVYCNANYHSERNTSKYCSSTCRSKAWQEKQNEATPDTQLPESFYQEFYGKLSELHRNDPQEKASEARAYIYEINCGYETPQSILQELTERIRYNLSFDDYRAIFARKYQNTKPEQFQITNHDVIVYLHTYGSSVIQ